MRSEPLPLIELDDSVSLPIPDSLPIEGSMGIGSGSTIGSAGRATGRAPPSELAWLRDAVDLEPFDREEDRELDLDAGLPLRLVVLRPLLLLLRPLLLALALVLLRLAVAFFVPPERDPLVRLAVLRRAVDFFAVDRLAVDRLAVDRFAVDFLADFFFAAICPPFGCAVDDRACDLVRMSAAVTCVYSIGIRQTQAPDRPRGASKPDCRRIQDRAALAISAR